MSENFWLQKYNLLSTSNFSQTRNISIIRSNIISRYSNECIEENVTLDTGALCCKWCLNTWSPENYSISLQPQKKTRKHLRRLLKKDIESLNKYQQQLVAKVRSLPLKNTLVLKCAICSKNTSVAMKKSGRIREEKKKEKEELPKVQDKTKKKKKKKSAYAGLNTAVVESVILNKKKTLPPNISITNQPKKQNVKQKLRINKQLLSVELSKKKSSKACKPSMLSSFLDGMVT